MFRSTKFVLCEDYYWYSFCSACYRINIYNKYQTYYIQKKTTKKHCMRKLCQQFQSSNNPLQKKKKIKLLTYYNVVTMCSQIWNKSEHIYEGSNIFRHKRMSSTQQKIIKQFSCIKYRKIFLIYVYKALSLICIYFTSTNQRLLAQLTQIKFKHWLQMHKNRFLLFLLFTLF